MTAALMMGSVGVKHAEMTSDDTKSNFGKRTWMKAAEQCEDSGGVGTPARLPADTNHPNAIVGTTMMSRLFT